MLTRRNPRLWTFWFSRFGIESTNHLFFLSLLSSFILLHLSFFFFNVFIFNWRIIALQCCVDFCHTSKSISHRYTYVPLLLNLPFNSHPILPSGLSQRTGLSSLRHTENFHWVSILLIHVVMDGASQVIQTVNACNTGDLGLIPGLGRSPGEGNGNPLQYCLENSTDRGAWQASWWRVRVGHGVTNSLTLSW